MKVDVDAGCKGVMRVMRFKSCPRCKGDIRLDRDHYGWYEECIQCGYMHDLQSIIEVKQPVPQKKRRLTSLFKQGNTEGPREWL